MQAIDVTHVSQNETVDVSQIGVLRHTRPIPKDLRQSPANPYGSRGERPYSGKGYRAPAKPTAARVTERPQNQARVGAEGDARRALFYKGYRVPGDPYRSRGAGRRPQSLTQQGIQSDRKALFYKGLRAKPLKSPFYKGCKAFGAGPSEPARRSLFPTFEVCLLLTQKTQRDRLTSVGAVAWEDLGRS